MFFAETTAGRLVTSTWQNWFYDMRAGLWRESVALAVSTDSHLCTYCGERVAYRNECTVIGIEGEYVRRAHFAHRPSAPCILASTPAPAFLAAQEHTIKAAALSGYRVRVNFPDRANDRVVPLIYQIPDVANVAVELVPGNVNVPTLKAWARWNARLGLNATEFVLIGQRREGWRADQVRWLQNRFGPRCHASVTVSGGIAQGEVRPFAAAVRRGKYKGEHYVTRCRPEDVVTHEYWG